MHANHRMKLTKSRFLRSSSSRPYSLVACLFVLLASSVPSSSFPTNQRAQAARKNMSNNNVKNTEEVGNNCGCDDDHILDNAIPLKPDDDATLGELGDYLWLCTRSVYALWHLRTITRRHGIGMGFRDNKIKSQEADDFFNKDKDTQVNFIRPELIITDDGAQDKNPNRSLLYPITPAALSEFIDSNRKYFKRSRFSNDLEFNKDFENFDESKEEPLAMQVVLEKETKFDQEIIDYDDLDITNKSGCVYGLALCHTKKIIALVFRGSMGENDMIANMNFRLSDLAKYGNNAQTHEGFTGYLFGKHPREKKRNYLKRIIASVNEAMEKYPEYKVYITGHSLGGGVASLFAFHLAHMKKQNQNVCKNFVKRITAVTWAAPIVGNAEFAKMYNTLEEEGYLRHIRITNQGDVVPSGAQFLWLEQIFPLFEKGSEPWLFKHNGVNVHMYANKKADIFHTIEPMSVASQLSSGFRRFFCIGFKTLLTGGPRSILTHQLPEYLLRYQSEVHNKEVRDLTVDGVYNRIGSTVDYQ